MSDNGENPTGFVQPDDLPVTFLAPGVAPAASPTPGDPPPPTGSPVMVYGHGQPEPDPSWDELSSNDGMGWGMGAVVLGIPVILGAALLFGVLALVVLLAGGDSIEDATTSSAFLFSSLLGQQLGMALWPILVSRRRGAGPRRDLRLRFDQIRSDIGVGVGVGFAGLVTAVCVGFVVQTLLALDDPDAAGNTQIIDEATSRPALVFLVILVVFGAPISEELYFRGMMLRASTNKWGPAIGGTLTTVAFTAIHFTGAGLKPTLALFATIGTVAIFFAVLVHRTKSLLPAMVAHTMFNAIGISAALLS